jgi:hypothetical protein
VIGLSNQIIHETKGLYRSPSPFSRRGEFFGLATAARPPSPVAEETPEPAPVGPQVVARELPAYEECRPRVPTHRDLLTLRPFEMAALTAFVVKEEGPIHAEEVARRIREAFGLQRTGNRILSKINEALRSAAQLGEVSSEEGFWTAGEQEHAIPRHRRYAAIPLRRSDRIAPREYRLAILQVVEGAAGIDREDLIVETARLLGFDRTGNDLHDAIEEQITVLLKNDRIRSGMGISSLLTTIFVGRLNQQEATFRLNDRNRRKLRHGRGAKMKPYVIPHMKSASMAAGTVVRAHIYERTPVRLGSADRGVGGLTAALIVVVRFQRLVAAPFSAIPAKVVAQGANSMPAALDPRFPHGTSPWAEGARGDEEKRGNGNHPSGSHH